MSDLRFSTGKDRAKALFITAIVVLLVVIAYLFVLSGKASAAPPQEPVKICSGGESGVYYAAAEQIRQFAKNALPIVNVSTEGTMDNLERIFLDASDANSCDVMIGQPDGPTHVSRTSPASVKKLRQVAKLHREYLHVLCERKADIDDLSDLLDDPKKYRVAIGENGSGSWLVWQNFISQREQYGEIPVSNEGGVLALSAVSSGDATCALMPSGLRHGTVNEAVQVYGDTIELVSATDKRFDDATDYKSEPLYELREFPKAAYPSTFHANWFFNTKTISWNAAVYVNTDKVSSDTLKELVKAISRAALLIKAEYGN